MLKFLPLLLIFPLSSCGDDRSESDEESNIADVSLKGSAELKRGAKEVAFQELSRQVEALHDHGVPYFTEHWPKLRKNILLHIEKGTFTTVDESRLKEFWMSLEYIRGCHYPEIFLKYSEDIAEVLLALDVPEYNTSLREVIKPTKMQNKSQQSNR